MPLKKHYIQRECKTHGISKWIYQDHDNRYRCLNCRSNAVTKRRYKLKELLVAEFGGKCSRCGYAKCLKALEFHHRNRNEKSFGLSFKGLTRSLEKLRVEAKKCNLLCANCHREVEQELLLGTQVEWGGAVNSEAVGSNPTLAANIERKYMSEEEKIVPLEGVGKVVNPNPLSKEALEYGKKVAERLQERERQYKIACQGLYPHDLSDLKPIYLDDILLHETVKITFWCARCDKKFNIKIDLQE